MDKNLTEHANVTVQNRRIHKTSKVSGTGDVQIGWYKVDVITSYYLNLASRGLRMINMSSEWEYDWYWKISACSTEYEACDSFGSLTRQQTSYSGSAGWYFPYQSIHIQIIYTYCWKLRQTPSNKPIKTGLNSNI